MKFKFLLVTILVSAALVGSSREYYVDAVNGNDAWDGTTSVIPSGSAGSIGPKRTLAGIFSVSPAPASGVTVHAAAGVYNDGSMFGSRVSVPAGVKLVGAPGSVIEGAADLVNGTEATYYCGANALRCVTLASGSVLKGFVLRNGHVTGWNAGLFGGAVNAVADSYIVDCVITNNYSGRGAVFHGVSVRCRFNDNMANTTASDIFQGQAFNCLFGDCRKEGTYNVYQTGPWVNCTFYGKGTCAHASSATEAGFDGLRNCVILKAPNSVNVKFLQSLTTYDKTKDVLGEGSEVRTEAEMKLRADCRQLRLSPVVDFGKDSYYDAFPAGLADEKNIDLNGVFRMQGAHIDIGCFETPYRNGQAMQWHVSASDGDDANDGWTASTPFGTLAGVFSGNEVLSGDTVSVAAGVYNDGSMSGSRVSVPAGVKLVGAPGSVIEGAADLVNGTEATYYCGANALRCVTLASGSVLKGFVLRNGHVTGWNAGLFGGAVNAVADSYIVDCVITNNYSGRGAVFHGVSVRCRFNDNMANTTASDIFQGQAFNCLFGDCRKEGTYNVYQTGPWVNCTFYGKGTCAHASSATEAGFDGLRNCVILKAPNSVNVKFLYSLTTYAGSTAVLGEGSKSYTLANMRLFSDMSPRRTSPAVDYGNDALYDNGFPAAIADEKNLDVNGNVRKRGDHLDAGCFELQILPSVSVSWYVDAVNGNDDADGIAADCAYRTLAGLFGSGQVCSSDIVYAAAGVYNDGSMSGSRVSVPAGVKLVGASGAVIEGAADLINGTETTQYCGANALRCVTLGAGAELHGFVLRSGRTPAWTSSQLGGAVNAAADSRIVDCVITNNYGGRGAVNKGISVRCRYADNMALTTSSDIFQGQAYNCLFGDCRNSATYNVYQGGPWVNCTFFGAGLCTSAQAGDAYKDGIRNGLVLKDPNTSHVKLVNCLTTCLVAEVLGEGSAYCPLAEMKLDEAYRPTQGSSAIDKGDASHLASCPVDWRNVDYDGMQRVYNAEVDVGAFEFDWRPLFARALKRKTVSVILADPGVCLAGRNLVVPAGNALELEWTGTSCLSEFTCLAEDGGTAVVMLNGNEIHPDAGGHYSFSGVSGVRHLAFSLSGVGQMVVGDFRSADDPGLCLFVR